MNAHEVISYLSAAGITLNPAPESGLIYASPVEALTDEHRALVRQNKPALMSLLTGRPQPLPSTAPEARAPRPTDHPVWRAYKVLVRTDPNEPARWVTMVTTDTDVVSLYTEADRQFGAAHVLALEA